MLYPSRRLTDKSPLVRKEAPVAEENEQDNEQEPKSLTQAEIDEIAAKANAKGKRASQREVESKVKELGFKSLDEALEALRAGQNTDDDPKGKDSTDDDRVRE